MPSIVTREYNPTTGEFVGNISSLSLGRIIVGTSSPVKVIDFAFIGVNSVSNIKLGLMNSGGIVVNHDPGQTPQSDGSVLTGKFGLEHTTNFDLAKAASPLQRFYLAVNGTGGASDAYNIDVENRSDTVSQFVYISLVLDNNDLGATAAVYKVFFDFE